MTDATGNYNPSTHAPILSRSIDFEVLTFLSTMAVIVNKKLSYRSGTARRAMSVEILSTAEELYEKSHLERLAIGE